MREAFASVIGNNKLRDRLSSDIAEGHLSHAYILEGPRGSGKHTIALNVAAALSCEHKTDPNAPIPCCSCTACRKILDGKSPDVIYINREDKATLGVDAIRGLRNDVYIAPNDVNVKLYIIEEAHLMTQQAQNAFLLTLEEPPPYVLFLLLCETTSTLLETVRSRAPTLRTEPVEAHEIGNYLTKTIPEAKRLSVSNPKDFNDILVAASGSIGKAISLLDPKLYKPIVERRDAAREFARLCTVRRNGAATLRFLNTLPQKRDELIEQCNEFLLCLRDLLLCKQTETAPLCFYSDIEEACDVAYHFTTPTLLALCKHVSDCIERLRQNANVRLALTTMAYDCGLL